MPDKLLIKYRGQENDGMKNGGPYYVAKQESPLSLTDPRDAVAQRMINIPYRIKVFLLFGLAAEDRSRPGV